MDYAKTDSQSWIEGATFTTAQTLTTECYWGLRSPVRWAKHEYWHEAVSWSEELYTKAYVYSTLSAALTQSDGVVVMGVSVNPWISFWDIAFLENLWYYWPNEDYPE